MLKFGLKTGGVLVGSFMLFTVLGCSPRGPVKPDGLPPLVPCEVTITQDGQPLVGALVDLRNKTNPSGWATDGMTDANGVAVIKVNGTFPGAPEGEYAVLVTKTEMSPSKFPDTPPSDAAGKAQWNEDRSREQRDTFRLVEPQFGDPAKTPHSMTVSKDNGKASFDVGKPIREQTNKTESAPQTSTYD